jgi:hypothetical protein
MSFLAWIVLGLVAGFIAARSSTRQKKEFSSISCWELLVRSFGAGFSTPSARLA